MSLMDHELFSRLDRIEDKLDHLLKSAVTWGQVIGISAAISTLIAAFVEFAKVAAK